MPDLTAKPLIQNGSIMLDPAPNGYVVQGQAPFRHPLFQVAVAERVPQIPLDAQNDNHVLEVSPPEQSLAVFGSPSHPTRSTDGRLQQILFIGGGDARQFQSLLEAALP